MERSNADIIIRENSWLAAIAARKLRSSRVAMVLGKTIHLHNTTREEFLSNKRWLKHELCHVEQFKKFGLIGFLARYLFESILKGYHNNKYEAEARQAEED
jgi:hypothetical protein